LPVWQGLLAELARRVLGIDGDELMNADAGFNWCLSWITNNIYGAKRFVKDLVNNNEVISRYRNSMLSR
jgi:hypothetical protein